MVLPFVILKEHSSYILIVVRKLYKEGMFMLFCLKKVMYLVLLFMISVTTVYGEMRDVASPSIVINLPSRMLELYSGNTLIKEYPVVVGKPSTPTPLGNFNIINKEINPIWIPPGHDYIVLSGPDNPLGYRWIGFLNLYGIHGTNAPWLIGQAVSNGCVRLQEENVEELFEVVKYGTPVRVTYDRIKVRVDSQGQATVGVYPDIYDRKTVTLAEVNDKLAEFGLKGLASETLLIQIIEEAADKQVPFAKLHNIKVNETLLTERAVTVDSNIYVPVWAIAVAFNSNIIWDEKTQMVWNGKRVARGVVKGDIIYINEGSIAKLFGGQQVFKHIENLLEINTLSVTVNSKPIGKDIEVIAGVLAVPALVLSDYLGKKVTYDAVNNVLVMQGKKVPVTLIDNQPYIQITKINEYFEADVFWDEQKHSIEITYPGQ
ncbi:MAG: ErfK/YbiS/YcfS/YnhG family protein [Firmicutes bacterium]|nr:ErfK/YbiS/YcfS/YnhG family protein [Bacillota bacterium]